MKKVSFMEVVGSDFQRFCGSIVGKLASYGADRAEDAVSEAIAAYLEQVRKGDKDFLSLRMTEKNWWAYIYRRAKWNLGHMRRHAEIDRDYSQKAVWHDLMTVDRVYTPAGRVAEDQRFRALLETLKRVCISRGVAKHNRIAYERCYLRNEDVEAVAREMDLKPNAIYGVKFRIERFLAKEGRDMLRRVNYDLFRAVA